MQNWSQTIITNIVCSSIYISTKSRSSSFKTWRIVCLWNFVFYSCVSFLIHMNLVQFLILWSELWVQLDLSWNKDLKDSGVNLLCVWLHDKYYSKGHFYTQNFFYYILYLVVLLFKHTDTKLYQRKFSTTWNVTVLTTLCTNVHFTTHYRMEQSAACEHTVSLPFWSCFYD